MKNRLPRISKLLIQSKQSLPENLWGKLKLRLESLDDLNLELLYVPNFERGFLDDA